MSALPDGVLGAWRELADRALEPNPFAEPDMVLPAARYLSDGCQPLLLTVADADGMQACLPVVRLRSWRRIPWPTAATWRHDYCFLGTPLVDPARPERSLAELLRAGTAGHRLLALEWMQTGGPVAVALTRAASATAVPMADYEQFSRAAIGRGAAGPGRLTMSSDHRRRLGRLRRSLGRALGAEALVVTRHAESTVLERFLALEASGWKGMSGTAMAARPGHATFFTEVCRRFDALGRLRLDSLEVGGNVVAIMCSIRAGDGLFLFKIAHDPDLGRYSPGTQLVAEVAQTSAPSWVDSGAAPDESWLNDLLPERRRLASPVVAFPGRSGRLVMSAVRGFVAARGQGCEGGPDDRELAGA